MSVLGELKRRRVFQVAVAYAVVAWVMAQVVDVVNEPLNLPGWFDTAIIVALAVGFPIAIVLAWIFDVTPQGVFRTPARDEAGAIPSGDTQSAVAATPESRGTDGGLESIWIPTLECAQAMPRAQKAITERRNRSRFRAGS